MRLASVLVIAMVPAFAIASIQPPDEASAERVEAQCTTLGQEFGYTGKRLANSIQRCVAQERPDLAVWEKCRTRGRSKGFKGSILRGFVTVCLHGSP